MEGCQQPQSCRQHQQGRFGGWHRHQEACRCQEVSRRVVGSLQERILVRIVNLVIRRGAEKEWGYSYVALIASWAQTRRVRDTEKTTFLFGHVTSRREKWKWHKHLMPYRPCITHLAFEIPFTATTTFSSSQKFDSGCKICSAEVITREFQFEQSRGDL